MTRTNRLPVVHKTAARGQIGRQVAICLALGAAMMPTLAQEWIGAAPGSWFEAANWNPATVPLAGGNVFVNNGSTAQLDTTLSGGLTSTPALSSLNLGVTFGGANPAAGAVISNGVAIQTSAALRAGIASGGTASFVEGVLGIAGAGASVGALDIGTVVNQGAATQAHGEVDVGGSLGVNGFVQVGQVFGAARGSQVYGAVRAGDLQGQVQGGFWIVGNVTGTDVAQVGSRSFAEVVAGGSSTLTLAGGVSTIVGTTFGPDRVVEAGGTFINQATGRVQLSGTLATAGDQGSLLVGRAFGGAVDGLLQVGTLAMGNDRFNGISVGTSTADGVARGRVSAGIGDLRHSGSLLVGQTTGGNADGGIDLGSGRLLGSGSDSVFVGHGTGSSGQLVRAMGSVVAGGGVAGYQAYNVGVLLGDVAAGSLVQGRLIGGADPALAGAGNVNVGFLSGAGGAAVANGEMRLAGPLGMTGVLQVAQLFNAAAGSSTQGMLQVDGDLGEVNGGFWIVGNTTASTAGQVGNQAQGELRVGGGMTLSPGTITAIGTTFGTDRVVDGADTRVNHAQGKVTIAGTLSTPGDPGALLVGRTFGGLVDGSLQVGHLAMGSSRFGGVIIGTSTLGDALGLVEIGGGTLRTSTLVVGQSISGTGQGTLILRNAGLQADSVVAGSGTGHGVVDLVQSHAAVADDFSLQNGMLSLARSLLTVGDEFSLGAGATLRLGIEGLTRETEYGAVDTALALLGGTLELDLSGLGWPGAGSLVFDLVRASDDIFGDFSAVSFFGLQAGYQASTGIFSVDDDRVYRLTLARLNVPEPQSALLVLCALWVLGATAPSNQPGLSGGSVFTPPLEPLIPRPRARCAAPSGFRQSPPGSRPAARAGHGGTRPAVSTAGPMPAARRRVPVPAGLRGHR